MGRQVMTMKGGAALAVVLAAIGGGCLDGGAGRPAGGRCARDGDCAAGLVCQYGRCRPVCVFDRDCPSGACVPSEVDPSVRVCVLPDEGGGGEPCPAGTDLDDEQVCRQTCTQTEDCPEGYECDGQRCRDAPAAGDGDADVDADADAGDWTSGGPYGAQVNRIVVDPSAPGTVYAAGAGFYRSDDYGDRWADAEAGLEGRGTVSLVMDSSDPRSLYAGTSDGVYATRDGAATWARASAGLGSGEVRSLAFSPGDPSAIFALVQNEGLYRSDDGGASWQTKASGVTSFDIRNDVLVVDPADGSRLWLGTWLGGVFRTADRGESWTRVDPERRTVYALAHGRQAGRLFAGQFDPEFLVSENEGFTWGPIPGSPSNVSALAVDRSGALYAGSASGIDLHLGGVWESLSAGLPFLATGRHLAIDPTDGDVLYVGTSAGVVRTRDRGRTWRLVVDGMPPCRVRALGVRADRPDEVLALTASSGLFASGDRARSWSPSSVGLRSLDVRYDALAVHPEAPGTMVVATFTGLYVSVDGGAHWVGPTRRGSFYSAVASTDRGVFYAAEFEDGLWRSDDWGESWGLTALVDSLIKALAVDSVGTVYAGSETGGLRASLDGRNWEPVNDGLPADDDGRIDAGGHIATHPSDPSIVYVATRAGVYRTANMGQHWLPTGLVEPTEALLCDPADPRRLVAGTARGVYESRDEGETWSGPELGRHVHALALSPDGLTLYAATDRGVWAR